jgi:hypothetical protein
MVNIIRVEFQLQLANKLCGLGCELVFMCVFVCVVGANHRHFMCAFIVLIYQNHCVELTINVSHRNCVIVHCFHLIYYDVMALDWPLNYPPLSVAGV